MKTIKDGRIKVWVWHGYNSKEGYFYGSHDVCYRKLREENGVKGVVYNGEFYPLHEEMVDNTACINLDLHARAEKARKEKEAKRRESLGQEGRAKEDRELMKRLIQMCLDTPRSHWEDLIRLNWESRHEPIGRLSCPKNIREFVKVLRFWDQVDSMTPEQLSEYGIS